LAAARTVLHGASDRITDRDPVNIECVLYGSGVRVKVVAQASTQAWVEYDTTTVHLAQAFGSGTGVHVPSELPHNVTIPRAIASWVPAQQELVATNGTESTSGSYLTVTLTHEPPHWAPALWLARAVAAAALAVAPRGPKPGAPPS
jgi:hypothetical protein